MAPLDRLRAGDAMANSETSIWDGDTLNRKADAEFLLRFLTGRIAERGGRGETRSFVLNLDASWGEGKTFFLERFAKHIASHGHMVACVNAWQDDHADDPLLAVMAAISKVASRDAKLTPSTKKSLKKLATLGGQLIAAGAKGALQQAAVRYIGQDVTEHIKQSLGSDAADISDSAGKDVSKTLDKIFDAEGKALFEKFNRAQRSIDDFKSQLKEFVGSISGDKKPPLFILIDELDRCRPSYAISLLERMKHLFDIENVIFVLATDTGQLSHAVNAVYGANFDGSRYLTRFFDRTYSFETTSRRVFIDNLLTQLPLDNSKISVPPEIAASTFISDAVDYFGLSLRDIEKVYDIVRTVSSAWDLKVKIELSVLLPLAIGYQQKIDPVLSDNFGQRLHELAKKNGPPSSMWTMRFRSYHGFGTEKIERHEALALFRDFALQSQGSLPDLSSRDVSSLPAKWIRARFSEEFALMYGNTHYPSDPPHSAILRYPELVKSAGRLLPTPHVPKLK